MSTNKFIITSSAFDGSMLFEYGLNGYLMAYSNHAKMTVGQMKWLTENFPSSLTKLEDLAGKSNTAIIKPVTEDLSFDAIWDRYDYKVGNKGRAQKLWKDLSDSDKIKVFDSLPGYNYYLSVKRIERLYLETYLNQRRFEADYKKLIKG